MAQEFNTTPTVMGGVTWPRAIMKTLAPARKWMVWATGVVNPKDANAATVELVYQKDDGTFVAFATLSPSPTGNSEQKFVLGPIRLFDIGGFAPAGVPAGEAVPCVRLRATKTAGVNGTMVAHHVWVETLGGMR